MSTDVKVVIWDLDETFWRGTLSEGPIEPIVSNIERVKLLNRRGIVNSICSKNDFVNASTILKELGLWDEFVFPSIAWGPKGAQVANILASMNLRAMNALFVDDNALNREEVAFYNSDVQVMSPEEWQQVCFSQWGKDDKVLSRLKNYKLLEDKSMAAQSFNGDNLEFLRSSEITVQIEKLDPTRTDMDRVVEVLNRTNQLNFTKRRFRSGIAQFVHSLRLSGSIAYVVKVTDKFGDYGLCGVTSVSGNGMLEDFAFSCRLLDMGVERQVLRYLKAHHDHLTIPFEESRLLAPSDWVNLQYASSQNADSSGPRNSKTDTKAKVFMPAACFTEVLAPFLQPEFSVTGVPELAGLSTDLIRKGRAASFLYWGGKADAFNGLFDGNFDVLLISTGTDILFPPVWLPVLGYFPMPIIVNKKELKSHPELLAEVKSAIKNRDDMFGRDMRDNISRWQNWWGLFGSSIFFVSMQTGFSPMKYKRRLNALRNRLPERTLLTIKLSEVCEDMQYFNGSWAALNSGILERVKAANEVAREFASGRANVAIIEPDGKAYNVRDMVGHFSHRDNVEIAQRLKTQLKVVLQSP